MHGGGRVTHIRQVDRLDARLEEHAGPIRDPIGVQGALERHASQSRVVGERGVHASQIGHVQIRQIDGFQLAVLGTGGARGRERVAQRRRGFDARIERHGPDVGGVPVPRPVGRVRARGQRARCPVGRRDRQPHVGGDVEQAGARRARRQRVRRHDGRPDLQVG